MEKEGPSFHQFTLAVRGLLAVSKEAIQSQKTKGRERGKGQTGTPPTKKKD